MPQSIISICNMALGHIGRSTLPIVSLTDLSVEARTCGLWYDAARQECLELYDWSFCRSRVTLALHNDPPPIEWAYRYQVPSGMLAFRDFWNPLANATLGGLTSSADGSTLYASQGMWNGYYGDLSNAVPYLLEESLDGKMPVAQDAAKQAGRAFEIASGSDANQQISEPVRDGYSARARM